MSTHLQSLELSKMAASSMRSVLVDRVKSPAVYFSKPGLQVAASLQALLTCVPILGSSWREPASHSAQRMRGR